MEEKGTELSTRAARSKGNFAVVSVDTSGMNMRQLTFLQEPSNVTIAKLGALTEH